MRRIENVAIRINLSAGFGQTQTNGGGWMQLARAAEAIGYESLLVADHLTIGGSAAFTAMASAAAVTETLRVGTYVLNNDFRHPITVAHEFAALADLSGGRATLGIGAGHMKFEYDQAGFTFDPAGVRVQRMTESVEIISRLLDGESLTFAGRHYTVADHQVREPGMAPVRVLVGGNGTKVLSAAGRFADVIGCTGFTPSADGSDSNISHFTDVGLAERITVARTAAGPRWPLPVDVLVQMVIVTDRADVEVDRVASRLAMPVEAVKSSPFVLIGSAPSIAERLRELNERLGVTSITVFANRPQSNQTERTMEPILSELA